MKKKLATAIAVLSSALLCIWINNAILWPFTGLRYSVTSESAIIMHVTPHSYDAWGFDYSDGHQFDGTVWRNLWHRPTWHRSHWKDTPNPSHHDGAAPAPSVDGVVGSLNREET